MRLLALLGVLSGVLTQAGAGDDAAHFPLPDGAQWVYKTREGRANTKVGEPGPLKEGPKRTIHCAEGKESMSLTTFDGKSSLAVRVIVTRDGVYQGAVDPANLILKFPLKKFDDWGPGDRKNGLARYANHGQREIEISGTKYLCWKITEQRSLPKGSRSTTRWYAPGIGLVWEETTEEIENAVTTRIYEIETFDKVPGRK